MAKKKMPTTDGDHNPHSYPHRDLHLELLRLIDAHPTWTQRQLAKALGVSLGKTNYCVRALKEKGLVKWGNFTQNPDKLSYLHILTPQGVAHKLRLTAHFLARKEVEFDQLRTEIAALRQELHPNDTAAWGRSEHRRSVAREGWGLSDARVADPVGSHGRHGPASQSFDGGPKPV